MRIQTLLFLVAALVTLTPFSLPVGPQTVTGSLVGHVGDQSGAVVAGARVVATDIERGTSRETVTNDEGNYTISSMEPETNGLKSRNKGLVRSLLKAPKSPSIRRARWRQTTSWRHRGNRRNVR